MKKDLFWVEPRQRLAFFVDGTLVCSPENYMLIKDKEIFKYRKLSETTWIIRE
jgi:hypothetical protein